MRLFKTLKKMLQTAKFEFSLSVADPSALFVKFCRVSHPSFKFNSLNRDAYSNRAHLDWFHQSAALRVALEPEHLENYQTEPEVPFGKPVCGCNLVWIRSLPVTLYNACPLTSSNQIIQEIRRDDPNRNNFYYSTQIAFGCLLLYRHQIDKLYSK